MAEPVHREIRQIARPGRAAVLIPNADAAWPMTVQNALESLTLTWGGIGDILVPTDATGMPLPVFRNVVRAFDPDYICGYVADQKDASSSSQFMYELRESMNPLTKGISEARDWCSPFKSQQFVFPHAASGRPLAVL